MAIKGPICLEGYPYFCGLFCLTFSCLPPFSPMRNSSILRNYKVMLFSWYENCGGAIEASTPTLAPLRQHTGHKYRGQNSYLPSAHNACTLSRHSCICWYCYYSIRLAHASPSNNRFPCHLHPNRPIVIYYFQGQILNTHIRRIDHFLVAH